MPARRPGAALLLAPGRGGHPGAAGPDGTPGAGLALATRGLAGALVHDGRTWVAAPARPVSPPETVTDTMGCGDAFLAGFAVSLPRAGWTRASPPGPETLRRALRDGADAAYEQCFVEAAFGGGRPVPAARTAYGPAGRPAG